ncbi:MAG: S-methyl-5-thioribose-1-phosphate isomerase, partial [Clostridiales bacterium]|nr:S-methyl-5-thioribose-1-phosphate isomerase [Clostridiales bacterium]
MKFKSIEFKDNQLILIDQRKLPDKEEYFICKDYKDVEYAIREMVVRGAPAIGSVASYGVALSAIDKPLEDEFYKRCEFIKQSRPTAVNLFYAIDLMLAEISKKKNNAQKVKKALDTAKTFFNDEI